MKRILAITIACSFAAASIAGSTDKGAKAIFIDSTSGSTIRSQAPAPATTAKPNRRKPNTSSNKPVARTSVPAPAPQPAQEVSGLMYYVELMSANGETSRVTTDRVFRSGERILLHVVSSIEGDIAVYQRTPSGHAARLFPDDRVANGSGRIEKGVDTILPSPSSWFRFDNQPGIEELTLVLTPRNASAEAQRAHSAAPASTVRFEDVVPIAGSKGLVVETDNRGPQQATYVVRRTESGRPPEQVVVRVQLEHR